MIEILEKGDKVIVIKGKYQGKIGTLTNTFSTSTHPKPRRTRHLRYTIKFEEYDHVMYFKLHEVIKYTEMAALLYEN